MVSRLKADQRIKSKGVRLWVGGVGERTPWKGGVSRRQGIVSESDTGNKGAKGGGGKGC